MTTLKLTPAPWRIGDAGHTVFGPPNGNPSPKVIAANLSRADARLIAAAPALLEACKLAFARLTPGDIRKDYAGHVAHVAMAKAIELAEGRP